MVWKLSRPTSLSQRAELHCKCTGHVQSGANSTCTVSAHIPQGCRISAEAHRLTQSHFQTHIRDVDRSVTESVPWDSIWDSVREPVFVESCQKNPQRRLHGLWCHANALQEQGTRVKHVNVCSRSLLTLQNTLRQFCAMFPSSMQNPTKAKDSGEKFDKFLAQIHFCLPWPNQTMCGLVWSCVFTWLCLMPV